MKLVVKSDRQVDCRNEAESVQIRAAQASLYTQQQFVKLLSGSDSFTFIIVWEILVKLEHIWFDLSLFKHKFKNTFVVFTLNMKK